MPSKWKKSLTIRLTANYLLPIKLPTNDTIAFSNWCLLIFCSFEQLHAHCLSLSWDTILKTAVHQTYNLAEVSSSAQELISCFACKKQQQLTLGGLFQGSTPEVSFSVHFKLLWCNIPTKGHTTECTFKLFSKSIIVEQMR